MKTTISRRGVIAALAAGAAVNVPANVMTAQALPAAPTASEPRPDAELLDLGRRYEAALAIEDAADEACTAAGKALAAAQPAMPAVLRHRMDDHFEHQFPALGDTSIICDDDRSDFYNEAEVVYLQTMPIRTDDGLARAAEIIAAWDGHNDACEALAGSCGYDAAEAAYYAALDDRRAIADAIVAAHATTLQGLAVRARIVTSLIGDDPDDDVLPTDQKMLLAIVRDLTTMAI